MDDRARKKKSPVEEFLDDVESTIEDWFQVKVPFALHSRVRWAPRTDVYETENEIHVTLEAPGLRASDVKVEIDKGAIVVRGVRPQSGCQGRRYHAMEIPVGPFERRIRLARPVRASEVSVTYENGLIEVTLPKARPESRDIPIE